MLLQVITNRNGLDFVSDERNPEVFVQNLATVNHKTRNDERTFQVN